MSLIDALTLALRGVRRRFGRAVLTVVAVGLAATLLTALLIISRTAESRVLNQLSKGGPLAGIRVLPSAPGPQGVDVDNPQRGDDRSITDDTIDRIRAAPGVKAVTPLITVGVFIDPIGLPPGPERRGVRRFADGLVGIDLHRISKLPVALIKGRYPAVGSRTEVAVSESYIRRMGFDRKTAAGVLDSKVVMAAARSEADGTVTGWWFKATVVGVVAQDAAPGMGIMSQEIVREAYQWQLTGVDGGPVARPTTTYSGLFVEATALDRVGPVRVEISDIGYTTNASENIIESVTRYLHVVDIVLTGVGLIAVGIASLGITNAMLSAVRERRREIGVIKALGARDRDVLLVFLIEAGMLGAIGGVIGSMLGWGVARGVGEAVNRFLVGQGLSGVQLEVPATLIVGSIVGSTALALLAGVVPARRAARLSAKEAVDAT